MTNLDELKSIEEYYDVFDFIESSGLLSDEDVEDFTNWLFENKKDDE